MSDEWDGVAAKTMETRKVSRVPAQGPQSAPQTSGDGQCGRAETCEQGRVLKGEKVRLDKSQGRLEARSPDTSKERPGLS